MSTSTHARALQQGVKLVAWSSGPAHANYNDLAISLLDLIGLGALA
jgi:hypothetical protein